MSAPLLPRHVAEPRLDIAEVARAAPPHLPVLCRRWLLRGKERGDEWICGSLAGEAGASCKVNLCTGRWAAPASKAGHMTAFEPQPISRKPT